MKKVRTFGGAALMGLAVGFAMAVALDDISVGIALGIAAFFAFGGLGRRGC